MPHPKYNVDLLRKWLAKAKSGELTIVAASAGEAGSLRNAIYHLQRTLAGPTGGLHGLRARNAVRVERHGRTLILRPTRSPAPSGPTYSAHLATATLPRRTDNAN